MTAAHCTEGQSAVDIWAVIGMTSRTSPDEAVAIRVEMREDHPNYDNSDFSYDFSLLKLETAVDFSDPKLGHVFPACWPTRHENPGEWSIISGWGTPNETSYTQPVDLQLANVTIISRDDCNSAYAAYGISIPDSMMCAANGTSGGIDACYGDSGGPLVALNPPTPNGKFELVGATSWGVGCARAGFPGVYADVYQVIPWMMSIAGAECPREEPNGCTAQQADREFSVTSPGLCPSIYTIFLPTEYIQVTSGSTCNRVTSKEECEEAARQLGLSDTEAHEGSWTWWVPHCSFYHSSWSNRGYLYFNNNGDEDLECNSDTKICICKEASSCEEACDSVFISNADSKDCNGIYERREELYVPWAPERAVYKHIYKDRVLFWNDHGYGWSIGKEAHLPYGSHYHAQYPGLTQFDCC